MVGLDFGAALALGEALDCEADLLAEILPEIEAIILARYRGDGAPDPEAEDPQD